MKATICDQCKSPIKTLETALHFQQVEEFTPQKAQALDFCGYGCLGDWAREKQGAKFGQTAKAAFKGMWDGK